jgi:hypothetical protein
MAGKFYDASAADDNALIGVAIEKLGLSQLDRFDPHRKIIEFQL